ncbi:MAG: hypothetical protein ACK4UJ_11565 [Leptonema sp. (in: bacteria)]
MFQKLKSIKKSILFIPGFIGGILLFLVGHQPNDDAYISFRHSRNFAEYGELVWNVKDTEKVLGTSSPLFSFLLGCFGVLFGSQNIPILSLYFNIFILVLNSSFVFKISHQFTNSTLISFFITLLISVNSYSIRTLSQGFEFGLFTFLMFANVYLLLNANTNYKKNIALILPNLLLLTRIEGIFIYPLAFVMLYIWHREKKIKNYQILLPFLFLFYLIFSYYYYNGFLPQSIHSKKFYKEFFPVFPLSDDFFENIRQRLYVVYQFLYTALFPILRYGTEQITFELEKYPYKSGNFFLNSNSSLLNFSFLLTFVVLYNLYKKKKLLEIYYFAYIPFFLAFVFYTIRIEFWYLVPVISVYLLFLSIGGYLLIDLVLNFLSNFFRVINNNKIYIRNFIMIFFLFLWFDKNFYMINKNILPFDSYRGILYPPGSRDKVEWERYFAYKETIDFLNKNHIKGEIATFEVGVLGFFYDDNLLDLFGLCSRKVIQHYFENLNGLKEDNTVYVLKKEKPALFISGMNLNQESPLKSYLETNYRIIFYSKFTVFGDTLYVWRRKDL